MKINSFPYKVTFNDNDFGIGDEHGPTIDFVGDDILALAQEVIADDPDFPMDFIKGRRAGLPRNVVGVFVDSETDDVIAVMYS